MAEIIRTLDEVLKNKNIKTSQLDYYKMNNSCDSIVKLVQLNSKTFSSIIEHIVKKIFSLKNRKNPSHDAIYNHSKIEIKSSRYWVSIRDFKFQHVMKNLEYDILILVIVEFHTLKFFGIKKTKVLELYDKKIVKQQGGGEGQGIWFTLKTIRPFVKELNNIDDLKLI